MSPRITADPLQPCQFDEEGYHDWANTPQAGTGDPMPGARTCLLCGAFDPGHMDLRVTTPKTQRTLFPAGTGGFQIIRGHDPDDPSPTDVDPNQEAGL